MKKYKLAYDTTDRLFSGRGKDMFTQADIEFIAMKHNLTIVDYSSGELFSHIAIVDENQTFYCGSLPVRTPIACFVEIKENELKVPENLSERQKSELEALLKKFERENSTWLENLEHDNFKKEYISGAKAAINEFKKRLALEPVVYKETVDKVLKDMGFRNRKDVNI